MTAVSRTGRRAPGEPRRAGKRPTPDGFTLNRPSSLAWFVSGVLALLLVAGWLSSLV
ncbi:hypothetical protein [Deinococcus sp.]|uniref:hypothetical protein n=1 Tax=Deinococcus sp. TaxID=47478 RepID=UPI00286DB010|nr:hypothetical protein [Deinococcus sp.]